MVQNPDSVNNPVIIDNNQNPEADKLPHSPFLNKFTILISAVCFIMVILVILSSLVWSPKQNPIQQPQNNKASTQVNTSGTPNPVTIDKIASEAINLPSNFDTKNFLSLEISDKYQKAYPNSHTYTGLLTGIFLNEITVETSQGKMRFNIVYQTGDFPETQIYINNGMQINTGGTYLKTEQLQKQELNQIIMAVVNTKTNNLYRIEIMSNKL